MDPQDKPVKNIIKAYAKLQSGLGTVPKNADNPYFKSKYTDLTTLMEYLKPHLDRAGLVVIQRIVPSGEPTHVSIETTLFHVESAECISSTASIPLVKQDPQATGSAITYLRRYSLATLLGVVSDPDDDAESAMNRKKHNKTKPLNLTSVDDENLSFEDV